MIAAIGVSGPAERLRPGRFKALGSEVVADHPRSFDRGECIEDPIHLAGLRKP